MKTVLSSELVVVVIGIILAGQIFIAVKSRYASNVALLEQHTQCTLFVIAKQQNQVKCKYTYISSYPFSISYV